MGDIDRGVLDDCGRDFDDDGTGWDELTELEFGDGEIVGGVHDIGAVCWAIDDDAEDKECFLLVKIDSFGSPKRRRRKEESEPDEVVRWWANSKDAGARDKDVFEDWGPCPSMCVLIYWQSVQRIISIKYS